MNGNTTTTRAPTGRDWERPLDGRILAGVSGAISRRLELPLWLVRLLFVILAFFGGTGFVLYLAGWFLIPRADRAESPAQQLFDRLQGGTAWIGVGLIALAVLILADGIGFLRGDLVFAVILIVIGVLLYRGDFGSSPGDGGSSDREAEAPEATDDSHTRKDEIMESGTPTVALGVGEGDGPDSPPPPPPPTPAAPAPAPSAPPPPRPPRSILGRLTVGLTLVALGILALVEFAVPGLDLSFRHYVGMTVTVLGLGLLVGTWWGRARWLIVVGVLLTPLLLLSPLADFEYTGEVGDLVYRPATVEEVQARYTAAIGQLVVDLRALELEGQTLDVDANLGIGELRILLPEGVAADVSGSVGMGEVRIGDLARDGLGVQLDQTFEGTAGTIAVDARTNIGQVRVEQGGAIGAGTSDSALVADRSFTIVAGADLSPDYEFLAGSLVLDLADLTLTQDRTADISIGTGDVTVILPDNVSYDVSVNVGAGQIEMLDETRNGLGVEADAQADRGGPELRLDIEVGTGSVVVTEGGRR